MKALIAGGGRLKKWMGKTTLTIHVCLFFCGFFFVVVFLKNLNLNLSGL